jgi:hypothetical protein
MADERTQDALDALADLFLTGLEPAEAAASARARTATERRPPSHRAVADAGDESAAADAASSGEAVASVTAAPRARRAMADPLDGPTPIRLAPKVTRRRPEPFTEADAIPGSDTEPFGDATVLDEEDAKPFLRLTPASAESSEASEQGESAEGPELVETAARPVPTSPAGSSSAAPARAPLPVLVEAVMLGNLPGVGSPWLTQYAQLLAAQEGPVAVLHLGDDAVEFELIEPGEAAKSAPLKLPSDDLPVMLEALVTRDASPVRTVLLHVEADADEPGLQRMLAVDHWTMLTGADDAAVVSAYGALKRLVERAPAAAGKRVGLMVMGSDEAPSRAAFGRVRAAADSFLHTPVQFVGWQKKLGPANVRSLGSFDDLPALWPRLTAFFDTLVTPELAVEPPTPKPAPTQRRRPPIFTAPLPSRTPAPARGTAPAVASRRPTSAAPAADTAEPAAHPSPAASGNEPDLAALLTKGPRGIPGGIALEARCPDHPDTRLVLDQTGRLHLLHRAAAPQPVGGRSDDDATAMANLRAAIINLLEARRWVARHTDVLALTQRQLRLDPAAEPRLHLLTDRADLATGLASRLGDTLRLHLLQQVRVGQHTAWFCTPLS